MFTRQTGLTASGSSFLLISWDPIIKYIKDQHSAYLRKELTAQRDRHIQDTRIHCCLFFINPTGHSLRPIDIIVMKKLSEVVNVVPVIAKSDSLTLEERDAFKQKVRVLAFGTSGEVWGADEGLFVCGVDSGGVGLPQHPPLPLRHRGER